MKGTTVVWQEWERHRNICLHVCVCVMLYIEMQLKLPVMELFLIMRRNNKETSRKLNGLDKRPGMIKDIRTPGIFSHCSTMMNHTTPKKKAFKFWLRILQNSKQAEYVSEEDDHINVKHINTLFILPFFYIPVYLQMDRTANNHKLQLHLILMCHCRSPEPPTPERRTSVKKTQRKHLSNTKIMFWV